MAHFVKCVVCGERFDRDKVECVQSGTRRYAHKACAANAEEKKSQEDKDKEALNLYIMNLFNTTFVDPLVQKQIKQYVEEYHYTYSGILKSLTYFYEVKGNTTEKANGRISIVPYVYDKAFRYYYSLWEAQQRNKDKEISQCVPQERVVRIPTPTCRIKKRSLFSFLDKEE